MNTSKIYADQRYPAQMISHAVWLYHRFTLSFRDVEELLAYRDVEELVLSSCRRAPSLKKTSKLTI